MLLKAPGFTALRTTAAGSTTSRGVGHALDRHVSTEVGDAEVARAQREPERDQPEVVLLAREAREQRARPIATTPAASQPEQPAPEDGRREVLLSHRDLATLPALAELVEIRENDLGQRRVEGRRADHGIEDGLGRRLVERFERGAEVVPHRAGSKARPSEPTLALGDEPRRLGRRQTVGEVLLHAQHALEVARPIETKPALRAHRLEEPVAPLPRAKELGTDARAPAQLADAEKSGLHAALTIQDLNSCLTNAATGHYSLATNSSYTGGGQMKKLDLLAATLLIVGGLNWGLVAVAEFDLVAWIFGLEFGETNAVTRIVYGLVGLSAVYGIGALVSRARSTSPAPIGAH